MKWVIQFQFSSRSRLFLLLLLVLLHFERVKNNNKPVKGDIQNDNNNNKTATIDQSQSVWLRKREKMMKIERKAEVGAWFDFSLGNKTTTVSAVVLFWIQIEPHSKLNSFTKDLPKAGREKKPFEDCRGARKIGPRERERKRKRKSQKWSCNWIDSILLCQIIRYYYYYYGSSLFSSFLLVTSGSLLVLVLVSVSVFGSLWRLVLHCWLFC